jgi:hypothetical protein
MIDVYDVPPPQRSSRHRSDFQCTAVPSALIAERDSLSHAIGYAQFYSRSRDAVIRVYDDADNVIETHEHKGDFKETMPPCQNFGRPDKSKSSVLLTVYAVPYKFSS